MAPCRQPRCSCRRRRWCWRRIALLTWMGPTWRTLSPPSSGLHATRAAACTALLRSRRRGPSGQGRGRFAGAGLRVAPAGRQQGGATGPGIGASPPTFLQLPGAHGGTTPLARPRGHGGREALHGPLPAEEARHGGVCGVALGERDARILRVSGRVYLRLFVFKKVDDTGRWVLRPVWGLRAVNLLFQKPPSIRLGSPACLAELGISASVTEGRRLHTMWGTSPTTSTAARRHRASGHTSRSAG